MSRESELAAFETLLMHAAYCTGQIRSSVQVLTPKIRAWPSSETGWNTAVLTILDGWGQTLARVLPQTKVGADIVLNGFPKLKPEGSVREALAYATAFTDEERTCLASTVADGQTIWALFNIFSTEVLVDIEDAETEAIGPITAQMVEELRGLHCLLGGDSPEQAKAYFTNLAFDLVRTQLTSDALEISKLEEGAARFARLKSTHRIFTIDLSLADLNPDRAKFESMLRARVADAAAGTSPDRFRDLWKTIFVEASGRFAWQPPAIPTRAISLTPSSDSLVRHATRVIAMVHELHKAAYQRIRMLPYLAPSGCYWRCAITYSDNVEDDGYRIRNEDHDGRHIATYSTGSESNYFGWKDASTLSARELAIRFMREFPLIAERGAGRDWMYAGWVTDVLGRAEQGRQEDLLYLMADWELEPSVLRDWQPPPPIRVATSSTIRQSLDVPAEASQ